LIPDLRSAANGDARGDQPRLILARILAKAAADHAPPDPQADAAQEIIRKWASLERSGKLAAMKETALQGELERLPAELHGKQYRSRRAEGEVKAIEQNLRAWVEVTEYILPQAFAKAGRVRDAEGKYVSRRLGLTRATLSEVQVAGLPEGTRCIARVPFPITTPLFSPTAQMVAFQARGEVFPLPDAFCEGYVVGLSGAVLLGNTQALRTGILSSRHVLNSVTWSAPQVLQIAGSQVDAWGRETPYQKTVAVAPR